LDQHRRRFPRTALLAALGGIFALGIFVFWIQPDPAEQLARPQSKEKMKQIASAFHKYIEKHKRLPPAIVYDKDGNPLHSWRVLLLPFLGEEELYSQFKLDEAWNSEHNIKLLPFIPQMYASPRPRRVTEQSSTFYQAFHGYWEDWESGNPRWQEWLLRIPNRSMLRHASRRTALLSDKRFGLRPLVLGKSTLLECNKEMAFPLVGTLYGLSSFYLIAEAQEPVPWTKPADLTFQPDQPLPKLGGLFDDGFHVATLDGEVRFVQNRQLDAETLAFCIAPLGHWSGGDWAN
jgi:hypothetical protein